MNDRYLLNRRKQYNLLCTVYNKVFSEIFNRDDEDHRMKLQKAIFCMQEMGVGFGDYGFRWDGKGPFSNQLSNDLWAIGMEKQDVTDAINIINDKTLSIWQEQAIEKANKLFAGNTTEYYNDDVFIEGLGSVLYLQRYVHPTYSTSEIGEELSKRKPRLFNNKDKNTIMAEIAKEFTA